MLGITTGEAIGRINLDLSYLQIELLRLDILVRAAVRRWQLAGQNQADPFRGLYITSDEAGQIAARAPGSNWGSGIELPAEEQAVFDAEEALAQQQARSIRREAAAQGVDLRLELLRRTFSLSEFEYNAFLVCLAPGLDLRYERLYAYLQDDVSRKLPSVGLILDLLLPISPERIQSIDCFRDQSPLLEWGLLRTQNGEAETVQSLLRRELVAAPELVSWLAGTYFPASELAEYIHIVQPHRFPVPLVDESVPLAWQQVSSESAPIMAFSGADELRKLAAALSVAEAMQMPLLQVNLNAMQGEGHLSRGSLRLALRDAALNRALPFFTGWDHLISENGTVSSTVLHDISWYNGPVLLSSTAEWRVGGANGAENKPILRWLIDLPEFSLRKKLWQHQLEEDCRIEPSDIDLLASQFTLSAAQIQDAALAARHAAFQQQRPVEALDLFEAARQQSSHQLSSLAVKVPRRYTWNDIVLPANDLEVLKEIAQTIRERPLVLEQWGLGKKLVASPGISALFAGQPGTGKTLAAQVIAEDLGMDLYKIDLSSVVSKYIGETEKNLERIFGQARNSNAILFFDEADAIFGKRSEVKDAHDRYANIEVGYLLQRMETYDGVVILATNMRSNLDDAFTRRLQFIVDFPFPDEAQRLSIWKVLFPPGAPREAEINFELLARRFQLAGGNIRNAIVSASFLAASEGAPVGTRHLLHGVRRELQKMGRLIDERELAA